MKLAVFGPRNFNTLDKSQYYNNYNHIAACMSEYTATEIISGGGYGVEQLAMRFASANNIAHRVIPPNIQLHGPSYAFSVRNREILDVCDIGLLLWDGKDKFYYELLADAVAKRKLMHIRHLE